jgi:hypothetical protein
VVIKPAAPSPSSTVLRAGPCSPETPFGVALALLAPALDRLSPAERAEAFDGPAALARTFLETGLPTADSTPSLIHGLYWFVANLASACGPVTLVVDDIASVDPQSLRLLRMVEQRAGELPVTVLAG